jgi:hypothetical protein
MPAAPSLEVLLNIQLNLETSFAAYFTANGVANYHMRSTSNLPDERVGFMIEVGGAQGHQVPSSVSLTGSNEEDIFQFTIKLAAQTERARATASPIPLQIPLRHDYFVAMVKKLMLRGALKGTISGITALSLSYYNIPQLTYSGDNYGADEKGLDTTEISYTGVIQILQDSWPVNA